MSKHPKQKKSEVSDSTLIILWAVCFVLGSVLIIDAAVKGELDGYAVMGVAIVAISVRYGILAIKNYRRSLRNIRK